MISEKFLFNTHTFDADTEFIPGLITELDDYPISIGNPCIISKQLFNLTADEDYMTTIIPFGLRYGKSKPYSIYTVSRKNVVARTGQCIANNGIRTIEVFDPNKLKGLSEFVDRRGSAVFSFRAHSAYGSAIPTGKNVIEFINKVIPKILARYRYHSTFYINYKSGFSAPRGDLRYILHFINIPNCVPIMNRYRVDGMGMVFNIVSLNNTRTSGHVNPVFCITIILSNFRENIFTIDGIEVEEQRELAFEHFNVAEKIINRSIVRKDGYYLKEKKKDEYYLEEKEKEVRKNTESFNEILTGEIASNSYTTTYTSIDISSSSPSYYYQT